MTSDFSGMLARTDEDLEDMGVGVDDAASILSSLEDQGLDSRTAMREFRQAAGDRDVEVNVTFDGGSDLESALWDVLRDSVEVTIDDRLRTEGRRTA